ncbi:MAG: ImmA/IrrE family metallo-endopeptidase [Candidatus Zixiibacteriota bacterium]|jgi:addiction module HigA family antidote
MVKIRANEYEPEVVTPPGETLLETMALRGFTQEDFAARTGRTPKTINEIVKGKAPITTDTALQFERVLGVPAEFWNNRERKYRESLARAEERGRLEEEVEWLSQFPVNAMIKLGWLRKSSDKVEQLRELLNFLGVASPKSWDRFFSRMQVAFRKPATLKADPVALAAWLRKGDIDAQNITCRPYDRTGFRRALTQVRALTTLNPGEFKGRIVEICAACGVAVVFVPELPKIRVSGATRWFSPKKAIIQVNLRYKTDDHFWFTFFHEAGHVLLDSKKEIFVDSGKSEGDDEVEANRFATECLIPRAALRAFMTSTRRISKEAIIRFAREQGVAPGIVVGQLQHAGYLPYNYCNSLKRKFVWAERTE